MSASSWVILLLAVQAIGIIAWAVIAWRFARGQADVSTADERSRAIFDDLEAEGTVTDFFPGKGPPASEYLL
jgi:hypothetical protein